MPVSSAEYFVRVIIVVGVVIVVGGELLRGE